MEFALDSNSVVFEVSVIKFFSLFLLDIHNDFTKDYHSMRGNQNLQMSPWKKSEDQQAADRVLTCNSSFYMQQILGIFKSENKQTTLLMERLSSLKTNGCRSPQQSACGKDRLQFKEFPSLMRSILSPEWSSLRKARPAVV